MYRTAARGPAAGEERRMRTAGRMARREKWNGGEGDGEWKKVARNNEAKEEDLALTRVSGMRFTYMFRWWQ